MSTSIAMAFTVVATLTATDAGGGDCPPTYADPAELLTLDLSSVFATDVSIQASGTYNQTLSIAPASVTLEVDPDCHPVPVDEFVATLRTVALERLESRPPALRGLVSSYESSPPDSEKWTALRRHIATDRLFVRWENEALDLLSHVGSFAAAGTIGWTPTPEQQREALESVVSAWMQFNGDLLEIPDTAYEHPQALLDYLHDQIDAAQAARTLLASAHQELLYLDTNRLDESSSREEILASMHTGIEDNIEDIEELTERIERDDYPLELLGPVRAEALSRMGLDVPVDSSGCNRRALIDNWLNGASWVDNVLTLIQLGGPAAAYLLAGTALGPVGIALGVAATGISLARAAEKIDTILDIHLAQNADAGTGELITDADEQMRRLAIGATIDLVLAASNAVAVAKAVQGIQAARGTADLARTARDFCLPRDPQRAIDTVVSTSVYVFVIGASGGDHVASDVTHRVATALPNAIIRCQMGRSMFREAGVIGSLHTTTFVGSRVVSDMITGEDWVSRFDEHLEIATAMWGFRALVNAPIRIKVFSPLFRPTGAEPAKLAVIENVARGQLGAPLSEKVALIIENDALESVVENLPSQIVRQSGRYLVRRGWSAGASALERCVVGGDCGALDDPGAASIDPALFRDAIENAGGDFDDPVALIIEAEDYDAFYEAILEKR